MYLFSSFALDCSICDNEREYILFLCTHFHLHQFLEIYSGIVAHYLKTMWFTLISMLIKTFSTNSIWFPFNANFNATRLIFHKIILQECPAVGGKTNINKNTETKRKRSSPIFWNVGNCRFSWQERNMWLRRAAPEISLFTQPKTTSQR